MSNFFEKIGALDQNEKIQARISDLSNGKKLTKAPIISCSRRTDIPAFLMDWLMEQLKQGYVKVINPFNRKIVSYVSLSPDDVKCWVWWSKDFGQWIKNYKKNSKVFQSYPVHIFNFTINSPSKMESGVNSSLKERLEQIRWLSSNFSIQQIQYRFDPIVFYYDLPKKDDSILRNNLDQFEYIVSNIAKMGVKDLIFSFATVYDKVRNRMIRRDKQIVDLPTIKKKEILDDLMELCSRYGVFMSACCQPELVGYKGIKQAHCVNGEMINQLLKTKNVSSIKIKRDSGQRESCGCTKSRDIGGYHGKFKCLHNCDYCYANPRKK